MGTCRIKVEGKHVSVVGKIQGKVKSGAPGEGSEFKNVSAGLLFYEAAKHSELVCANVAFLLGKGCHGKGNVGVNELAQRCLRKTDGCFGVQPKGIGYGVDEFAVFGCEDTKCEEVAGTEQGPKVVGDKFHRLPGLGYNAFEKSHSVNIIEQLRGCPLRMWHHAKHVAPLVAYSGNVVYGAIGIGLGSDVGVLIAIAENDLVVVGNFFDGVLIGIVSSFAMGNGNF